MKLAVMQPYFFPYIGYWQLIHAVDTFVLLDEVQYIRHGWVNRNRVLKPGGGWQYVMIPLRKHSMSELIKNVHPHAEKDWKSQIIRQLAHYNYGHKNKAPYYAEVIALLQDIFGKISNENVAGVNALIIKQICNYLGITTRILVSSDQSFDYEGVSDAGEWALRIAEQMKAEEYTNPVGGVEIFDPDKYRASNIKLSFLKSDEIKYSQGVKFEPWLSILDVLMFNGRAGTRELLDKYSIVSTR